MEDAVFKNMMMIVYVFISFGMGFMLGVAFAYVNGNE